MKKYVFITALIILTFAPFLILKAQHHIPSIDVELSGSSITFEEGQEPGTEVAERRKLKVKVADESPNTNASAIIVLYSLDDSDVMGPYTVNEGAEIAMDIDDREWGVEVLSYSTNSFLSVWIE